MEKVTVKIYYTGIDNPPRNKSTYFVSDGAGRTSFASYSTKENRWINIHWEVKAWMEIPI